MKFYKYFYNDSCLLKFDGKINLIDQINYSDKYLIFILDNLKLIKKFKLRYNLFI